MPTREPHWWYSDASSWQRIALAPAAALYGAATELRFKLKRPYRATLPVICVGNFTAGGTGKTPMALALADIVEDAGGSPWFLSRGFGGRLDGQERVDPARHTAAEVGDEPLLLAKRAPTVISRNRALGAEFIARQAPANAVIIMDDGLQNPSLTKDLTIALVDGVRGIGNGAVIPAGPLRARLPFQLRQTDVIVVTGEDQTATAQLAAYPESESLPRLSAEAGPRGDTDWLKGRAVVAFAGIANPQRFFGLLGRLGANVVKTVEFPDHATLANADAERLLAEARAANAMLVTTEKDHVRLGGLDGARAAVRDAARTLPIALRFSDDAGGMLKARIAAAIEKKARASG